MMSTINFVQKLKFIHGLWKNYPHYLLNLSYVRQKCKLGSEFCLFELFQLFFERDLRR